MVIRAVVFDFDGLILDTEVPIYRCWRELYSEHGEDLDVAMWQSTVGTDGFDPAAELERRLGRRLAWDELHERRRRRRDELQALESLRPGVADWVKEAQELGLRLGIASSSERAWVLGHLERLGFATPFACIRGRDDVGAPKPSPAAYRAVLEHLGVSPAEALGVEDSVHGVRAATAAGMWCVAVPGPLTRGLDFSEADLVLDSLADLGLAALLRELRLPAPRGGGAGPARWARWTRPVPRA
ncbi:MAG TPA: HAD-IA family hydrolase [Acidimicrobiales bacterium]|nr:HAD-IA family hydrolase [Acidimicrobiales bacterium]